MYQIVTIRLLDFYLVEDVDSRDAENEGLSLVCSSNGCRRAYFGLSMESKRPHKAAHLLRTVFASPLGFELE